VLFEYALAGHHVGIRFEPRKPWALVEFMFSQFNGFFHRVLERVLQGSEEIKIQFAIQCRFRKSKLDENGEVVCTVRDE
jgi:hypothetical protein